MEWFNSPGSVFEKIRLMVYEFQMKFIDFWNSSWFGGETSEDAKKDLGATIAALKDAMRPTNSNYGSPTPNVNLNVNNNISGGGIIDTQTQYAQGRAGLNTMFNNVSFESQTSALNAIVDAKG